jgi:hypothetical protein
LSHRYGMIFVPNEIEQDVFETLLKHAESKKEIDLYYQDDNIETDNILTTCYKLDTNSKPFYYKLLDMELLFENYDPEVFLSENKTNYLKFVI